jgi:hypothetical protein
LVAFLEIIIFAQGWTPEKHIDMRRRFEILGLGFGSANGHSIREIIAL